VGNAVLLAQVDSVQDAGGQVKKDVSGGMSRNWCWGTWGPQIGDPARGLSKSTSYSVLSASLGSYFCGGYSPRL
jgi:hypothetical protein